MIVEVSGLYYKGNIRYNFFNYRGSFADRSDKLHSNVYVKTAPNTFDLIFICHEQLKTLKYVSSD